MPTLDQIGEALRRADAAGNTDDARQLAQAYAQMRDAQGGQPKSLPTVTVRPNQDDIETNDARSSSGDFLSGIGRGLWATAQGAGQLITHGLSGGADEAVAKALAKREGKTFTPSPLSVSGLASSLDDQARQDEATFNAGAGSTFAGKAGNVTGGILATAPIGAASIPAKGAT